MWFSCHDTTKLRQENADALNKPRHSVKRRMNMLICVRFFVFLFTEVTKRVYFIGNERMLIAHDSNRLRFS